MEFSLEKINKVKNMDNMSEMEKKHFPVISAPEKVKSGEAFDVEIEVGKLLKHPNEQSHWINWIALWLNEKPISFVAFYPAVAEPKVRLKLKAGNKGKAKLVAREFCNLHGIWESEKEIDFE